MKPEQKCVSLETAKKLKEAGFPQDTERFWCSELGELTFSKNCKLYGKAKCGEHVAHPDAQELLEAIHKHCNEVAVGWNDSGCYWMVNIGGKGAGSFTDGCGVNYGDPDSDSLPDSLAKAWIEYEAERKQEMS